ncbi:MAG: DUF4212 domain-containing protein [Burkholderiales bacterium]
MDSAGNAATAGAARRLRYWRRVRRLTLGLLLVWAVVTLTTVWFARELNAWQAGGFPVGFWLSAQGAILVYLLLIVVYAFVMDRWDAAWRAASPSSPQARADA